MLGAMKLVLWVWAALVAGCGASPSRAEMPPSSGGATSQTERTEHIARIERGLLPVVQVKGENVRSAIEARMREHKIPAVSIAVFENYQLQWAKAYGMADPATGERATEDTLFLAG